MSLPKRRITLNWRILIAIVALSALVFSLAEVAGSGGGQAIPINLSSNSPSTNEFNEKALNKSNSQLKAYWSKLVFTGKGTPPKEVDSDAEMLSLISNNPSFIGYIDSSAVTDAVKVVAKF